MEQSAIRVAIDLLQLPSRVHWMRAQPLPDNLEPLLKIASGDVDVKQAIAEQSGRSPELIHKAAVFFIEQILLAPDAGAYRTLGLSPDATYNELRRNLALLLRSIHPDRMNGDRSLFAYRIIGAWDSLKTPERRANYDAGLRRGETTARGEERATRTPKRRRKRRKDGKSLISRKANAGTLAKPPLQRSTFLHRILSYLIGV